MNTTSLLLLLLGFSTPTHSGAAEPVTLSADGNQPRVASAPEGRVVVAYGLGTQILSRSSDDSGATFGPVVEIASPEGLMLGRRRGPQVAISGNSVVITAIGATGDLLAWHSEDGGATWSPASEPINDEPKAAREGLHALVEASNGAVFASWLDIRTGKMRLMGSRSDDGGVTWGEDVLIYESPDGAICTCCQPSLAFEPGTGTISAMWRNDLGGARDLYLTESTDGGNHFGPASKLGSGTWTLDACPMDGGGIAPGLTVWRRADRLFATDPDEPDHEVFLGVGSQPVTAGGAIAWQDAGMIHYREPGADSAVSIDPGSFPSLASEGGHLYLTWEGEGGGVRFLRR